MKKAACLDKDELELTRSLENEEWVSKIKLGYNASALPSE